MEAKEFNLYLVDEKFSYDALQGFVSDSELIDASVMKGGSGGCYVDVPTPKPSVYYF